MIVSAGVAEHRPVGTPRAASRLPADRPRSSAIQHGEDEAARGAGASRRRGAAASAHGTVPGHARRDFDQPLRFLTKNGIIEKRDGKVAFCDTPWMPSLRRFLRGYLRLNSQFVREARERIKTFESAAGERAVHGLFRRTASERMLTVLAVNGPMRLTALCDATQALRSVR